MRTREEIWENVPGWPYQVSTEGRVRSLDREVYSKKRGSFSVKGRIMSTLADNGKYRYVTFSADGKRKNFYIHRLVAAAFCRRDSDDIEVNHKDGDKFNNFYKNLEWTTTAGNREHAVDNDLMAHGEANPNVKMTKDQVHTVLEMFYKNPMLNRSEVAKRFEVGDNAIRRILLATRWRRIVLDWCNKKGITHEQFFKKAHPGTHNLMSHHTGERNRAYAKARRELS